MKEKGHIEFGDWLEEELQDEELRAEYERLAPGFEVAKLRMRRGLTQAELARRAGTHQSSISRLESGDQEPSLSFLRRVVKALDGRLEIRVRDKGERAPIEEEATATQTIHLPPLWEYTLGTNIRTNQRPEDVSEREMVPA